MTGMQSARSMMAGAALLTMAASGLLADRTPATLPDRRRAGDIEAPYSPDMDKTRRQRKRAEKRFRVTHERIERQKKNDLARIVAYQGNGYMREVNRLTNWQRNQWARAGYPKDLVPFLNLKRRKA